MINHIHAQIVRPRARYDWTAKSWFAWYPDVHKQGESFRSGTGTLRGALTHALRDRDERINELK